MCVQSLVTESVLRFCGDLKRIASKDSDRIRNLLIIIIIRKYRNRKNNKRIIITRKLQLQATVKRFQFDLHLNLEGQHMLVSSWFQR